MTRGSILAVVTEGSLTCPPWRSHLEVDLQSETRPRLAVAQMHRVRGYIFDEARVYEHSSVVWSVTSAAVHLQRYSCVSVYPCICDISVYLHVKVECWKRAAHAGAFRVPHPRSGHGGLRDGCGRPVVSVRGRSGGEERSKADHRPRVGHVPPTAARSAWYCGYCARWTR